jgi:hypothetical protein
MAIFSTAALQSRTYGCKDTSLGMNERNTGASDMEVL